MSSLVSVKSLCDSISDPFVQSVSEVVLINTSDVYDGNVTNHELSPNKDLKGQFKKAFAKEDILFSEIRPKNRRFAFVNFDATNYVASTKLMVLRAKKEKVTPLFLYYVLKSEETLNRLQHLAESRSGTFPQITFSELEQIQINLPTLEDQEKIVSIIKSFDQKISLNNQINDYLVEISKYLTRRLFESSNLKTIKLADIATFDSGYSYKSAELQSSTVAMVTIGNFTRFGNFKKDGFKEICPSSRLKESHQLLEGDIVVAHTDVTQNADIIGRSVQVLDLEGYERAIYSCDLVKVTPKNGFKRAFLAALLSTHDFKNHCMGFVNGTTVLHLSKKALPTYECVLPESVDLINEYSEKFETITKLRQNLSKESSSLIALRDSLLPKLLSGEIQLTK